MNLNKYWVKTACSCIPFITPLYEIVASVVKGGTCGKFVIFQVRDLYKLNATIPITEELEEHRDSFHIVYLLLILLLLSEIGSRVLIRFKKSRKIVHRSLPAQQGNTLRDRTNQMDRPPKTNLNENLTTVKTISATIEEQNAKFCGEAETSFAIKKNTSSSELLLGIPSTSNNPAFTMPEVNEVGIIRGMSKAKKGKFQLLDQIPQAEATGMVNIINVKSADDKVFTPDVIILIFII